MSYKYNKEKKTNRYGRRSYMDKTKHGFEDKPETEGKPQIGLSLKSLKALPKSSYSVMADPYTAALPGSEPYPIINKFNRHFGGVYGGEHNLDGGDVQQYSNSVRSKLLSAFDVFRLGIKINYQYLPIKPRTSADANVGKQLINEVRKAISEAISVLQTTTYTQMQINDFVVETDLPMGDAETTPMSVASHPEINVYKGKTDVFYAMSIYYQLFIQELANTLRWHNSFRLKQGEMIRNAWDRETALLNNFFGLMNKKSFLNLIDSLNLFFEGEYVDKEFLAQAGTINYAPSRRSESLLDPVLEIQTSFNRPSKFKVYLLDAEGELIWDPFKSDYVTIFSDSDLNITIGDTTKSFWQAIEEVNDYLSMEATTLYARTTTYTGVNATDNARFNNIKKLFDYIILATNAFKPRWSDFRQALDTLSRAGITRWEKGWRPTIEQSTDAPLFNNLLVNDIYRFILGGAKEIAFNNNTKRFRTFSLWNMYEGIPEYDTMSGGAFLSYSFKDFNIPVDSDGNLEYLPIVFEKETVGDSNVTCVAVNRGGAHVIDGISYNDKAVECKITVTDLQMSQIFPFNRLVPLISQDSLILRVPTIAAFDNPNLNVNDLALLYKALLQTIGYCKIWTGTEDNYDYGIDPDIVAVYQIEILDTTNMAITFARNCGPIRGTNSPAGVLGFSALVKETKASKEMGD